MVSAKTQTKLIVLMGMVLGVFLLGMVFMHQVGKDQAALLSQDKAREKTLALEQLVRLLSRPLQTLSYDYTFWDEMVEFVATRDSAWAYDNVHIGLQTYETDAGWVFAPTGETVYTATADGVDGVIDDSIVLASIRDAMDQSWFNHWFIMAPLGVVELYSAPIQPSNDNDRKTEPRGYFVVAKIWDTDYLAEIERAIDAEIAVKPVSSETRSAFEHAGSTDRLVFTHTLPGLHGKPVARLICEAENTLYTAFRTAEFNRMIYLGVFCLFVLLIMVVALHYWLGQPLHQVMLSLQTGSDESVQELYRAGVEFGKIGELIGAFLEQKSDLEVEILERRRTEEAVRSREGLLRATLESTADGILVASCDGRVTHRNEKFLELWRIPKELANDADDELLIGYVLSQLKDPTAFITKVTALYASSDESFDTLEFLDGRVFDRYSCPLAQEGRVVGRVWSFRDVTQQRKAEEARLQLQESLERAQRMESLGLLAGGVAHDLNNILGPVVGYSELLMRDVNEDPRILGRLQKINRSAQEAAAVIQDLLALARRGRYEMHPLNINQVVNSYVESVGCEKLRERHPDIRLNLELNPAARPILGSEVHLGKVVMNLVTNAFEAMPLGGCLTIVTEQAHLDHLYGGYRDIEADDYVILRVKDTGTGIAKEDIAKIFEPYFSRKTMGRSGSGLGLSIVYSIVKDHHGYYDILSEVGKGTEFILYFPASEKTPAAAADKQDIQGGTERVLVVDDRPEQREMACEIIASLGYSVQTAENGHQAVEIMTRETVDVIVLDMIMEPDFDGLDTYREILKICPRQKAVIVSGFSATDRTQQTLDLGAGRYVRKPYSVEELARALREELDTARSVMQDSPAPA